MFISVVWMPVRTWFTRVQTVAVPSVDTMKVKKVHIFSKLMNICVFLFYCTIYIMHYSVCILDKLQCKFKRFDMLWLFFFLMCDFFLYLPVDMVDFVIINYFNVWYIFCMSINFVVLVFLNCMLEETIINNPKTPATRQTQ